MIGLIDVSALAILVVLIEVAMCRYVIRDYRRNPLLDALQYRRDPLPSGGNGTLPKSYFSGAVSDNSNRCLDKCAPKANSYDECTVEIDWQTDDIVLERCTPGGGKKIKKTSRRYFEQVKSSRGDKYKDECKPKGGYRNWQLTNKTPYAWCIIDFDWRHPKFLDFSRCTPALKSTSIISVGKGTSMCLECLGYGRRGECDYHCKCKDGTDSCGDCGKFKSYKWCAVKHIDQLLVERRASAGITANLLTKLASRLF